VDNDFLDTLAALGERPAQPISPAEAAQRAASTASKQAEPQAEEHGPEWAAQLIDKHANCRFDPDNPPPEVDPILTLAGTPVLTPGNIAVLCAQSGQGKSHVCAAIQAAPMASDTEAVDALGWTARNPAGKALVYLDFEQSTQDNFKLMETACRRAGIEKPPPWLHAYHLTGLDPSQARAFVEAALLYSKDTHGGTFLLILDGIADLSQSVNDEQEAIQLVRELHALAIEYETGILAILHLNPGSEFKTRGHLGSQAERKAETVLTLKRDSEDAISIFSQKARHAPIPEGKGPRFQWDEEWGGFLSTQSKAQARQAVTDSKNAQLARDLFAVSTALSFSDAVERLSELTGAKVETGAAKQRLARLRGAGFVFIQSGTGFYHLGDAAKEENLTPF
jgi:hypothetical protein